jgi:hypothetical protein
LRIVKNLLLSATRHNEGKTVLALGLAAAFQQRGKRVGYIKPIGYANMEIGENRIDADATLMKEACGLAAALTDITPVALEGFPADWTTKEGREHSLEKIRCGLQKVGSNREFAIIEATGNAAAGAAFGLSNAYLAQMLNARVVIVASGGVGQPTDEVILNTSYYQRAGVQVLGVVVNKVYPHEFDRIDSFMSPLLESMKLKLLGAIPHDPDLARPTLRNLLDEFRGRVLFGDGHLDAKLGRFVLGAATAVSVLDQLEGHVTLLCPADRDDVVLAALGAAASAGKQGFRLQGVIFAGKTPPDNRVVDMLKRARVPAAHVDLDAYSVASMIHSTAYKISVEDEDRRRRAEELVAKYVEVGDLVEGLAD